MHFSLPSKKICAFYMKRCIKVLLKVYYQQKGFIIVEVVLEKSKNIDLIYIKIISHFVLQNVFGCKIRKMS